MTLSVAPEGCLLFGDEWAKCHSLRSVPSTNPATGAVLAQVPVADDVDVDRMAQVAARGSRIMADAPVAQRSAWVRRLAAALRAHREELAVLDTRDCGNLLSAMRRDIDWAADALDYFAGLGSELKGETLPGTDSSFSYTIHEPYGVVLRINPFNHPGRFGSEKLGAALMAGNAVIMKPAEQTPLSSLAIAHLARDIFPPGAVNVVTGDARTGDLLVRHPVVRRIAVIGSCAVGRAVMRAASDEIKSVSFELGGKNALIVGRDMSADEAAEAAVTAMNLNRAGQSCSSTSRIFVPRALHDRFVDALVARLDALRIGSPESEESQVGCLVSREHQEKVLGYVASGVSEGARLLCGGGPPSAPELAKGAFVVPAAFAGVDMSMKIAREEIFGPVMAVLPWDDEERLVAAVNDTIYGLNTVICTRDYAAAHRLSRRVKTGYVCVNIPGGHELGAPFGGMKQSGAGREECLDELFSFTETKTVRTRYL